MNLVVVGLSASGLACVKTLIKYGSKFKITAITDEDRLYSRCLLTYYLGRELSEKELDIYELSEFKDICLITNTKLKEIKREKKLIVLDNGNEIHYDKLVLAIGSNPLRPTYCKEENNVFTLRYFKDAVKIEKKLKESAIIVGGGYVGIKSAYGLYKRKVKTTMIISSPYPLSVTADEETGRMVEKKLKEMGIDIKLRLDVIEVNKKNGQTYVLLRDGTELLSDLVIVGKGVKPNIDLAKNAGLECNNGILVDGYLRTSDPDIYAIGDCAETYDLIRKETNVNAIWPCAEEQGYYCALNLLHREVPYPGTMAMNSLKMNDFHLVTAGILKGDGITLYTQYSHKNQLRKIALKDNLFVGMAFLNNPEDAGVYLNLLKKGDTVVSNPKDFLASPPILNFKL